MATKKPKLLTIGGKGFSKVKDLKEWLLSFEEIEKWFKKVNKDQATKGGMSEGTKTNYVDSLRYFCVFTQLNPSELILEVWEERKRILKSKKPKLPEVGGERILAFFEWLQKEREMQWNTARRHFGAMQSFYHGNGFQLDVKTPKQEVSFQSDVFDNGDTPKVILTKLYWEAKSLRDRAIIACGFSSGMGIGDLINLNYSAIKKQFEAETVPIVIKGKRKKTKEPFITYFGKKAVKALQRYLGDRERRYGKLKVKEPLFVQDPQGVVGGKPIRVKRTHIAENFRRYAHALGYNNEKGKQNPLRPYFLRDCFKQAMTDGGAKTEHVKSMMGHSIGAVDQSYWKAIEGELRKTFLEFQRFVEVTELEDTNEKLQEVESRFEARAQELEADNKELRAEINNIKEVMEYQDLARRKALGTLTKKEEERFTELAKKFMA